MAGSFDTYQVLYSDGPPTTGIRLGQILVDESEADPLDMLKVCTDLDPLTYSPVAFQSQIPTVPVGANPTASVGLSAVNGVEATFMRSDAAPALSQSIAPTWTGAHLFNGSTIGGSSTGSWSGTHDFTAQTRFQSNAEGGTASAPAIRFVGDADTGFFQVSTGNQMGVALNGLEQMRWDSGGIPVKLTGVSDASQPSCRISHYTTDFGTERGYWGYPTTASDTMILRNIVGTTLQLRTSDNTNRMSLSTTGVAFNGASIVAPPNYTVTNPSTSRSLDVSGATLAQLRAVVGTMIADLIATGLYE